MNKFLKLFLAISTIFNLYSDANEDLVVAAKSNDLKAVRAALAAGAQVDYKYLRFSALMHAALNGYDQVVDLLLKANANPNIQDEGGYTVLSYAANRGYDQIVDLLLKANANPNIYDPIGQSALTTAVDKGYDKIVDLLLKANANPNGIPYMNPLIIAVNKGHAKIVDLLLKFGADT